MPLLRKDGTISSLKTDGLHRTLLELSKKHNVTEQSVGTDVTWNTEYFSLGAIVFTSISAVLSQKARNFTGNIIRMERIS